MARKRASMREGPLAELFRATEAAQKQPAENAPEGKEANRRTWFVNAELKGKAIGGGPVDGGGKNAGDPCK